MLQVALTYILILTMLQRYSDVFNTCATDDDCYSEKTYTGEAMGNWVCSGLSKFYDLDSCLV